MKYMLLVYSTEDAWTEPEHAHCLADSTALCMSWPLRTAVPGGFAAAPGRDGDFRPRLRNGNRLVTDGPFAETTEQLGGYFLIEAANLDDAIAVAGKVPAAAKGTVKGLPAGLRAERFASSQIGANRDRGYRQFPIGEARSARAESERVCCQRTARSATLWWVQNGRPMDETIRSLWRRHP